LSTWMLAAAIVDVIFMTPSLLPTLWGITSSQAQTVNLVATAAICSSTVVCRHWPGSVFSLAWAEKGNGSTTPVSPSAARTETASVGTGNAPAANCIFLSPSQPCVPLAQYQQMHAQQSPGVPVEACPKSGFVPGLMRKVSSDAAEGVPCTLANLSIRAFSHRMERLAAAQAQAQPEEAAVRVLAVQTREGRSTPF
jgi:hypothetical protein